MPKNVIRNLIIGSVVAALVILLRLLNVFEILEFKTMDYRFRLRGPLSGHNAANPIPSDSLDIVLVEIDDDTWRLSPFDWPYPRDEIWGRSIRNLSRAGAAVIILNIMFDSPSLLFSHAKQDSLFSEAISEAKAHGTEVVLSVKMVSDYNQQPPQYISYPIKEIMIAEPETGLINDQIDADGISRRYAIAGYMSHEQDKAYLTLGMKAVRAYLGIPKNEVPQFNYEDVSWSYGSFEIPSSGYSNTFKINYYGPPSYSKSPLRGVRNNTFPRFSLATILDDRDFNIRDPLEDTNQMEWYYPDGYWANSGQEIKNDFKEKIVIIGVNIEVLHDYKRTPFDGFAHQDLMPGMEVHANAIQTILHQNYILETDVWIEVLLVFILVFGVTGLVWWLGPFLSGIASLFLFLIYFDISIGAFLQDYLWLPKQLLGILTGKVNITAPLFGNSRILPVVIPGISIILAYIAGFVPALIQVRRERKIKLVRKYIDLHAEQLGLIPEKLEPFHQGPADGEFSPIAPNPYIVGNPIRKKNMFYGRDEDFQFVREKLGGSNQNAVLVLYGKRRTGKTSILYQILNGELGEGFLPILFDMQSMVVENERELFVKIAAEIISQLGYEIISADNNSLKDPDILPVDILESILKDIHNNYPNKKVLLLFDEYELIETKIQEGVLTDNFVPYLASLLDKDRNLSLVFTGSRNLEASDSRSWQRLLGKSLYRKISYLRKNDTMRLITEPVMNQVEFGHMVPEAIFSFTGGQPFYTQVLCQNLVDQLNADRSLYADMGRLNQVLAEIVENPMPQMIYTWENFSSEQKVALSLLSENTSSTRSGVDADQLLLSIKTQKYGIVITKGELTATLESLVSDEFIFRDKSDNYHFRVGLMRLWIRKAHSVWQVIDEVGDEVLKIIPETKTRWYHLPLKNAIGIAVITIFIGVTLYYVVLRKYFQTPSLIQSRITVPIGKEKVSIETIITNVSEYITPELKGSISVRSDLKGVNIYISTGIIFSQGTDSLISPGKEFLTKLAPIVKDAVTAESYPYLVVVGGHTDNDPMPGFIKWKYSSNWELSATRASAVKDYLLEVGDPNIYGRISSRGFADSVPIKPNDTPEGKAANRRVEIVFERQFNQ